MDTGEATKTFSAGTLNIISDTRGVLHFSEMYEFLKQIRSRIKAKVIARCFTSDIPALVKQLKNIEANYDKQKRERIRMDKDIDFIRRLHKRLDSREDLCVNNGDYFFEEYHNEGAHHARHSEGCRNEHVFASTSACEATTTLSAGIWSIISDTKGVLPFPDMRDFLNQVRGRKTAKEIAGFFTCSIHALSEQLKNIEANYQKQRRERIKMDKDIGFIRRLRKRLDSRDNRCVSNDDFFFEVHQNEGSYQEGSPERGRNEHVFASTPVCKQESSAATKCSGRRKMSLSRGTIKIISNTKGSLNPAELCKFLNQVRGKRKATEIASCFTSNIPALINQLQEIETNYSRSGRKGVGMKKDIDFIRRLRIRLQEDKNNAAERFKRETVPMQGIKEEYPTHENPLEPVHGIKEEHSTDENSFEAYLTDEISSEEYSTDEDSEYSSSASSRD